MVLPFAAGTSGIVDRSGTFVDQELAAVAGAADCCARAAALAVTAITIAAPTATNLAVQTALTSPAPDPCLFHAHLDDTHFPGLDFDFGTATPRPRFGKDLIPSRCQERARLRLHCLPDTAILGIAHVP